jgi:hypothetical protein
MACYRRAQPFKNPKLSGLRSILIFNYYLAESIKCFDYLYFYFFLPWLAYNRDKSKHYTDSANY